MRKKNFKGRCEKRVLAKCADVCRTYDPIQYVYADLLSAEETVQEIRCNVPLDGAELEEYSTDFVCIRTDGDLMVRECVWRKHLTKPMTSTFTGYVKRVLASAWSNRLGACNR